MTYKNSNCSNQFGKVSLKETTRRHQKRKTPSPFTDMQGKEVDEQ